MDYWDTDVYRYYSDPSYARPRKIVDNLKLDWLDVGNKYYSPEVVFFTKTDIQELSGWTEDEVRLLFFDRRFPSCIFGRKEVVEIHALIVPVICGTICLLMTGMTFSDRIYYSVASPRKVQRKSRHHQLL